MKAKSLRCNLFEEIFFLMRVEESEEDVDRGKYNHIYGLVVDLLLMVDVVHGHCSAENRSTRMGEA